MILNICKKQVGIFAHAEKVCFFFRILNFPSTIRAFPILKLAFGPKALTGGAIFTVVGALVNIPLIIEPLKDFLYLCHMLRIRGANKFVVGRVHQIPDAANLSGHAIYIFLRRYTGGFRLFLNFLAVLVGAGLEVYTVAGHALISGDGIGEHDLIGVADVGFGRSICNGR